MKTPLLGSLILNVSKRITNFSQFCTPVLGLGSLDVLLQSSFLEVISWLLLMLFFRWFFTRRIEIQKLCGVNVFWNCLQLNCLSWTCSGRRDPEQMESTSKTALLKVVLNRPYRQASSIKLLSLTLEANLDERFPSIILLRFKKQNNNCLIDSFGSFSLDQSRLL